MRRRQYILLFFILKYSSIFTQSCNFWPIGYREAINFSKAPATFDTSSIEMYFGSKSGSEGSASISDCNGNLLFYTNGAQIWNKNHDTMPNGKLYPYFCICLTEKSIIIPKPGSNHLYFVFYFTSFRDRTITPNITHYYVKHALINMNLNNGLGGVVYKDSVVSEIDFWSMNLSWSKHSNNRDLWLVFAKNEDTAFSLLVDSTGISKIPIVSSCFFKITTVGNFGNSRFSHDFRSFITTGHSSSKSNSGKLLMYNFDRTTGKLSSPKTLMKHTELPDNFVSIVEFSPNDSFIYFVADTRVLGASSFLYQLNRYTLVKQAIKSFNYVNKYYWFRVMQLGPDNQIYTTCFSPASGGAEFWRIQKPDLKGINSSMTKWVNTNDEVSQIFYFPDFYIPRYIKFALSNQKTCNDTSIFVYHGNGNEQKIIWRFGDGDSLIQYKPIVKGDQVKHAYNKPGKYTISLEAYSLECNTKVMFTDTTDIIFTPKIKTHKISENRRCIDDSVTITDTLDFVKTYIIQWGDGFSDTFKYLTVKDSLKFIAGHKYLIEDTFKIVRTAIGADHCETSFSSTFISKFLPKPKLNLTFAGYNSASIDSPTTYTACKNFTLTLADSTTSIISTKINWGDGNSIHQNTNNGVRNYSHQYTSAGVFTLTLTDTNSNGCQTTDSVLVKVQPTPEFKYGFNSTAQCLKGNQFIAFKTSL